MEERLENLQYTLLEVMFYEQRLLDILEKNSIYTEKLGVAL